QAEDGIRVFHVTWSSDVCSSDLTCLAHSFGLYASPRLYKTRPGPPLPRQLYWVKTAPRKAISVDKTDGKNNRKHAHHPLAGVARSEERRVGKDSNTQCVS